MNKILKILTRCVFVCLISNSLCAQSFVKTISSNNDNYMMQPSIESYGNNSVIVSTNSNDIIPYSLSGISVKMVDASGNIVWQRRFLSNTQAMVGAVTIDYNTGISNHPELIVITGSIDISQNVFYKDTFILRLKPDGSYYDYEKYRSTPDHGIYGFDIESTNDGYIVVGVRIVDGGFNINEPKQGHVFSVNKNLDVNWSKLYKHNNTNSLYNSFNHILRIEDHPLGDEVFVITGSGGGNNLCNMLDLSTIVFDLIDENGNSLWGGAKMIYEEQCVNSYGYSSLYNKFTNELYITGTMKEDIFFLVIDGNDGEVKYNKFTRFNINSSSGINYSIDFISGMDYKTGYPRPEEDPVEILISGTTMYNDYESLDISEEDKDKVYPFLTKLKLDDGIYNIETRIFNQVNKKSSLLQINFDHLMKPITYSSVNLAYHQAFYKPKSLVVQNSGIKFLTMSMNQRNGFQNLNLYSIISFEDDNCIMIEKDLKGKKVHWWYLNNFIGFYHNLRDGYPKLYEIDGYSLNITNICNSSQRTSLNKEKYKMGSSIGIYPIPAEDQITISSGLIDLNNSKIYVYDLKGREIINQNISKENNVMIDISAIQSGIYFIKIINENNELLKQQRIIKK